MYNANDRTDFLREFEAQSASSILQILSCRFLSCNLIVCVFLVFRICLCLVQFKNTHPPGIFLNRVGRVFGSVKRAGLWRYNPSEKSPQALCTSKVILDLHFLEITSLLWLLNCNCQNRQGRAYRIELADLDLKISLVKSILSPA